MASPIPLLDPVTRAIFPEQSIEVVLGRRAECQIVEKLKTKILIPPADDSLSVVNCPPPTFQRMTK